MSAETLRRAAELMRERAEADAAHIASWHPDVALKVAASLDQAASIIAESKNDGPFGMAMRAMSEPWVEVARAYLGESA